jgi:hypothetical protein
MKKRLCSNFKEEPDNHTPIVSFPYLEYPQEIRVLFPDGFAR